MPNIYVKGHFVQKSFSEHTHTHTHTQPTYCSVRTIKLVGNHGATYPCDVAASAAVVTRKNGAVDDFVFAVGTGEARSTVAPVATESDITTHGTIETRLTRRTVVQIYTRARNLSTTHHN